MNEITHCMNKNKSLFVIIILCLCLGGAARIFYCIKYPVQPRDVSIYIGEMENWEKEQRITVPYLSLYLLNLPHKILKCDIEKGGICVNVVVGQLIIILSILSFRELSDDKIGLWVVGLVTSTHPTLIQYSCVLLRENTYLLFCIMSINLLILWYKRKSIIYILLGGVTAALSFLCRYEGLEICVIYILMILFHFKALRIRRLFVHLTGFLIVYATSIYVTSAMIDKDFRLGMIYSEFCKGHGVIRQGL